MAQIIGQYINPVLTAIKKLGGSARPAEVCSTVIEDLGLEGDPMLEETLKSGASRFENKIAFVRLYLALTGYIDRSNRGVWTLTDKGRNSPELTDLEIQELLLDVQRRSKNTGTDVVLGEIEEDDDKDENEAEPTKETNYKVQILEIVRNLPSDGFERLCQRLLRESGFQQVEVTGRSGDGGIDGIGILKVNHFVAFKVLFQCKRYSGSVSPAQVREFQGAMQGRADKGIILTTGSFTSQAAKEAVRDGAPPIELVDGERLIELFEKLELGLTARTTYDVDVTFFEEFKY